MSNVVYLHRTTPGRAAGTGIAVAMMATRYGATPEAARAMGQQAKEMVERGHSGANVRSAFLSRLRRTSELVVA